MWSAIPVALLCMTVNLSEEKQGSGPEGDEVLQNTGGLSFVLPEMWMWMSINKIVYTGQDAMPGVINF